jgi:hypothetical protein
MPGGLGRRAGSFEPQRTLSFYFFLLSAERAESKNRHPFGSIFL